MPVYLHGFNFRSSKSLLCLDCTWEARQILDDGGRDMSLHKVHAQIAMVARWHWEITASAMEYADVRSEPICCSGYRVQRRYA